MTPPRWIKQPETDVPGRALDWLASPALAKVVAAFTAEPTPRGLTELVAWAGRTLDTRAGRERQDAPEVLWSERQVQTLLDAADHLGLSSTHPPSLTRYDATVVLAGTATANRLRSALLGDLQRSGMEPGVVIALGSDRAITAAERDDHPDAAATEWRDLAAVTAGELGYTAPTAPAREPPVDLNSDAGNALLQVLSTPAPPGRTRPNTADALRYLRSRLIPPARILLVTSAVYAPYTFFTASNALAGWGCDWLEVIGTPSAPPRDRRRAAQAIAQEINSTLRAMAAAYPSLRPDSC